MFVYGGIDSSGDYLNDVWEYYFKKKMWYKTKTAITEGIADNMGLAYHRMVSVYEKYRIFSRPN